MPRTFVYGTFLWVGMSTKGLPRLPSSRIPPPPEPYKTDDQMAVEILREFGASELVGRLYSRIVGGEWLPVQPSMVLLFPWYETFTQRPSHVVFDLEASGPWEVLFVRRESDEQGVYIAVALRRFEKAPAWVGTLRQSLRGRKGWKI
jgi:hypothetical protein